VARFALPELGHLPRHNRLYDPLASPGRLTSLSRWAGYRFVSFARAKIAGTARSIWGNLNICLNGFVADGAITGFKTYRGLTGLGDLERITLFVRDGQSAAVPVARVKELLGGLAERVQISVDLALGLWRQGCEVAGRRSALKRYGHSRSTEPHRDRRPGKHRQAETPRPGCRGFASAAPCGLVRRSVCRCAGAVQKAP
jgi:hypothetical protein